MGLSKSDSILACCLIFNNNTNNSPPPLLIPLLEIVDITMVFHMDSHTNSSACFQSCSSLGYSQLSTQSDHVTCQIMSPMYSNHSMSSCFIQSKSQSPNKRLDDSICTSTPTLPPYCFSSQIHLTPFSHPPSDTRVSLLALK